jgi:hypothetical protein
MQSRLWVFHSATCIQLRGRPAHANVKWAVITEVIGTLIWPENSSLSSHSWQACWSSQRIEIVWKLWSPDPDLLQPVCYPLAWSGCHVLLTVTAWLDDPAKSWELTRITTSATDALSSCQPKEPARRTRARRRQSLSATSHRHWLISNTVSSSSACKQTVRPIGPKVRW